MDMSTKSIAELNMLVSVARGFFTARQIAYDHMQKDSFFEPWFREAETTYLNFCEQIGMEPDPVFDEKAHEARRIAQGHPDYPSPTKATPNVVGGETEGEWELYGFIGDYSVWHDGEVYQVTKGDEPSNRAGYRNLEALLRLKGLHIRDLEAAAANPGP